METLSRIAHDLRNALGPVLGFSDLALSNPRFLGDRERMRRYMEAIKTSARDADGVIERLRALYRNAGAGSSAKSPKRGRKPARPIGK